MTTHRSKMTHFISQCSTEMDEVEFKTRLASKRHPVPQRLKNGPLLNAKQIQKNWDILKQYTPINPDDQALLADPPFLNTVEAYSRNIENCIGTVKIPVGIAGPLRINGLFAQGDYYVPLATTEAALVASYNRGARLISTAGGCRALLINEGISRSPGFIFETLLEASQFLLWIDTQYDAFFNVAASTSRFGRLMDMRVTLEGNHVYLNFDYLTGDAAGQNIVTLATAAILDYIAQHTPVAPKHMFIDANLSGDKKASSLSYLSVRGKKVTVEVVIEKTLIQSHLHTTPELLTEYWRLAALGGVMSGTLGVQGHFANGLAAIYLATGQDAACVSESSVGVTRLELTHQGDLYAAVTLPNIVVGTVGGGTALPTQAVGLRILGLQEGTGQARAFAEIVAATCLAGELSIMGAMSAGHFAAAHQKLARRTTGSIRQ
jgi:hydroxymethylglutaryl-CoA reductase (NADPH)